MIDTEVQIAGKIVLSGGIILYPTDTIWGIGCDAIKQDSIQRIYQIKQRADSKSMLVLVNSIDMLEKYVTALPP
jgi:L-threonylcarbamoyladenylate synthase